jgi:hypothetical protein
MHQRIKGRTGQGISVLVMVLALVHVHVIHLEILHKQIQAGTAKRGDTVLAILADIQLLLMLI